MLKTNVCAVGLNSEPQSPAGWSCCWAGRETAWRLGCLLEMSSGELSEAHIPKTAEIIWTGMGVVCPSNLRGSGLNSIAAFFNIFFFNNAATGK